MSAPDTPRAAIETDKLSVHFGSVRAVDQLSIRVEQGDIFGFIGPNGAGKTTTIKTLVTLLRPTSGQAYVLGNNVVTDGQNVRKTVGYMPDFPAAYPHMQVCEYLEFFAAAYGIAKSEWPKIVDDVLELTDLGSKRLIAVGELSRGMQQRVSLARVLVHNPQVLILDEPAAGLDPRARIEVMEILRELSNMGKTIFISSHILSELRALCNRVAIIEKGSLVYCGALDDLLRRTAGQRRILVKVAGDVQSVADLLASRPEIQETVIDGDVLALTLPGETEDISFIAHTLVTAGHKVQTISEEEVHLEDAFMKVTEGTVS